MTFREFLLLFRARWRRLEFRAESLAGAACLAQDEEEWAEAANHWMNAGAMFGQAAALAPSDDEYKRLMNRRESAWRSATNCAEKEANSSFHASIKRLKEDEATAREQDEKKRRVAQ